MKIRFLLSVVLFSLSACALSLMADYDSVVDDRVSVLHKKTERYLLDLASLDGNEQCSYAHNADVYNALRVDVSALAVRTQAIDQNDLTVSQVKLLADSFDKLEQLHKLKDMQSDSTGRLHCFSSSELEPLRDAFHSSFVSILRLELAKKRGDN